MLWTDGRYFIQANMELSSSWEPDEIWDGGTLTWATGSCRICEKETWWGLIHPVHAALPTVELQGKLRKSRNTSAVRRGEPRGSDLGKAAEVGPAAQ